MNATASPTSRTRIEEAKARFTIPALWRMFNLRGDPGSPCRSPFREDRSPSFSVFDCGRRWIDHATAERGDAVEFLAKIKGISNPEAFIELLKMVDGPIQQPAAKTHHSPARTEPRRGPELDGIERCSKADLWQLANLRVIPLAGLMLAQERKLLFAYQDPYQGRCWLVTDDARRSAIYRRLDGKRFHYREAEEDKKEGPKSKTWKGSEANWPIGISNASGFPALALCEGMPDALAAFALAYAGAVESLVAPICMTGSSCHIHEDALRHFRGKRVRIFGHADETGQDAVQRWAKQLQSVEAEVDGFFFEDKANNLQLVKADGSLVKDLNDFLAADHKRSGCPIEVTTGAFDFALERRLTK